MDRNGLTGPILVTESKLYEPQAAVVGQKLGTLGFDKFGNRYRLCKNGSVALVTAHLLQESVEDAQFVSMAVPAAVAIGATEITVTNGTTAVTANMFVGGRLTISTSTGIGQSFYILKHTTGASGAAITYTIDRPLLIALTTSSKVSTRVNPYNGVIEYPVTTQTGAPVGFALTAVPAGYYFWSQTGGDTPVLFDTATNTSNGATAIAPSAAVAGSVAPVLDAVGALVIGMSRQVASVDSTVSIAHIMID